MGDGERKGRSVWEFSSLWIIEEVLRRGMFVMHPRSGDLFRVSFDWSCVRVLEKEEWRGGIKW